jgi:pyridoxamine 5'-phosphate oxidase
MRAERRHFYPLPLYKDKTVNPLTSGDFTQASDPFLLFSSWMEDAVRSEPEDPNAMALASVDASGCPNVRIVLLKSYDENGFVFYTNTESAKGRELLSTPKAAFALHWKSLHRQIRARGSVARVSDEEADAYFASRHRESQIGAWASMQSRQLESREKFEQALHEQEVCFKNKTIPRPPYWNGFRITPASIEFWHDRPYRLHDRIVFENHHGSWVKKRLYP